MQTEAIRDNTLFHAHDVPSLTHKADLTLTPPPTSEPQQNEAPASSEGEPEPDAWVVLAAKQYQELKKNK